MRTRTSIISVMVVLIVAVLWLAWPLHPQLEVASMLNRIEAGAMRPEDVDRVALAASLAPQIQQVLDDEQATARRWAAAGTALRGTAAAFHLVASLPVLVLEPMAPRAAASVKRTQAALLPEPAPLPPDTAKLAQELANVMADKPGTAALIQAAFERAPETWPETRFSQFLFVRSRLQRTGDDTLELPLEPSGIALGWRNRLTVLQFQRNDNGQWVLHGIRLPPSPDHARVLLNAVKTIEIKPAAP